MGSSCWRLCGCSILLILWQVFRYFLVLLFFFLMTVYEQNVLKKSSSDGKSSHISKHNSGTDKVSPGCCIAGSRQAGMTITSNQSGKGATIGFSDTKHALDPLFMTGKCRFKTFVSETMPVTKIFEADGRLRHISSAQSVEAVWEQTRRLFA